MKQLMIKVFFVLLITASGLLGQSPYSRFGVGVLESSFSGRMRGLANAGVAFSSGEFINNENPAAIGTIDITRFSLDVSFSGLFLKNSVVSSYYSKGEFEGMALAFPIYKPWGIVFAGGLVPYSKVNYNIRKKYDAGGQIGEYNLENFGKGGISKGFGAFSYLLPLNITFGARFGYYFGQIENNSKVSFSNGATAGEFKNVSNYDGFGADFGLITHNLSPFLKFSQLNDFRVGANIEIFPSLSIDTMLIMNSSFREDSSLKLEGTMKMPARITLGTSFSMFNQYRINLDFSYQDMSKLTKFDRSDNNLQSASRIAAGIEYTPKREAGAQYNSIIWRGGVSYEQLPVYVNGVSLSQWTISAGCSLPLSRQNFLDVAIAYAARGESGLNIHSEREIRLNATLNLSEMWFVTQDR